MFNNDIRQYLEDLRNAAKVHWTYKSDPTKCKRMDAYLALAKAAQVSERFAHDAYALFEPIVGFITPADPGEGWITPLMVKEGDVYVESYSYLKDCNRNFVHCACMADYSFTVADFMMKKCSVRAEDQFAFTIRLAIKITLGMT